MNQSIGLFQVIDKRTEDILGTAFALEQAHSDNLYYVITAYHVVAETIARGGQIIIRDENRYCHSVRMISPQLDMFAYCHPGKDYAVFELVTSVRYKAYIPQKNVKEDCEYYIRGAAIHYRTAFTKFPITSLGIEKEGDVEVLTFQMSVHSYDDTNNPIRDQDVLRGMSGSPIFTTTKYGEECVGILGNVGSDKVGLIRYAVPISTVLLDPCFALSGSISLNYNDIGFKIASLFGGDDPDDFVFYDEQMDQMMWKRISNWFFWGIPIDYILYKILVSEEINTYNPEVRIALWYYYSRLLYKRGQKCSGKKALHQCLDLERSVSQRTEEKITALTHGRLLIESDGMLLTTKQIRDAGDNIAEIKSTSDSYKAYEIASLYGKGLINLFSLKKEFTPYDKTEIKTIYHEQVQLYKDHEKELARQDVVITAVEWYMGLWKIDSSVTDAFEDIIRKGFKQSKIRKNDIFHVQSMLAYGIYLLQNNRTCSAMVTLSLCAMLMRNINVHLYHEGIAQLCGYLNNNYRKEYAAFQIIYLSSGRYEMISKLDVIDCEFRNTSWKWIVDYATEMFRDLYAHLLIADTKTIYKVKLNDIESRLLL